MSQQQSQLKPQQSYQTQYSQQEEMNYGDKFNLSKIKFMNNNSDTILLKDVQPNSEWKIQYSEILYQLKVKIEGDSMLIYIVQGPAGEQCNCCHGSGKK